VRLAFCVHGPVFGGGHMQFVRLREPLERRGWEIVAVCPAAAPAAGRLREAGVETIELPLQRLRATADPRVQVPFLARAPREVAALRRLLERGGIDAVQAHGDTNPHVALAAHRAGRAVVWQLYDTRTPVPARRLTMPLVLRVADVVTTWGRALGRAHPGTERLGERWIGVYPPVDEREFSPPGAAARAAARRELAVPEDAFAILAVGNRNPSKGYEHLVRALGRLRERRPRAVVRVLGAPSPPHAAWEQGVLAQARRLGLDGAAFAIRDGGADVPRLLAAADAFALTSVPRSEGMPTVILEAMACALPVVATDVGAVAELVQDGVSGSVVAPGDDEAIAAALEALARDAGLRARQGEEGRRRFRERFSLERLADVTAGAYALALEHRRARLNGAASR
jgi:glycosyltransferase involved in cell wall biosynthesis